MATPAAIPTSLDVATLKSFEHAAAGHEGALSDESGALFIKPSTQQEIDFYQTINHDQSELLNIVPTYMGTLSLGSPSSNIPDAATHAVDDFVHEATQGKAADPQLRQYGNRIATEVAIVLENLEHGFRRPCVMDLKLGAKLCAPGTAADKVARIDKVAAETTSGSLNFRIAGMKVWNGASYDIYDKRYGRAFSQDNVNQGFATFFAPLTIGLAPEYALHMLHTFCDEIEQVRLTLEAVETRMFSSSVLIIYEGDIDALKACMVEAEASDHPDYIQADHTNGNDIQDDDDQDDDDRLAPTAYRVSLIDFAHASFAAGEGNDANTTRGLLSIEEQLQAVLKRAQPSHE